MVNLIDFFRAMHLELAVPIALSLWIVRALLRSYLPGPVMPIFGGLAMSSLVGLFVLRWDAVFPNWVLSLLQGDASYISVSRAFPFSVLLAIAWFPFWTIAAIAGALHPLVPGATTQSVRGCVLYPVLIVLHALQYAWAAIYLRVE